MKRFIAALFVLLIVQQQAMADSPPSADDMRKFTVQLSSSVSAMLFASVPFQKKEQVLLCGNDMTGQPISCLAEVREWTDNTVYGPQTIRCQEVTDCAPQSQPSCVMAVVDYQHSKIIKVLATESVAYDPQAGVWPGDEGEQPDTH